MPTQKARTYRIHRVKGCGRGLWEIEIVRRLPDGGAVAVTGRSGESVASRTELQALCNAGNSAPDLLAALRLALPHIPERAMIYSEGTHGDRIYVADAVRAAIAAAEGHP